MFFCTKSTEILDGIRGPDNFSYLSLILAFGVLKSPGTLENFWSNASVFAFNGTIYLKHTRKCTIINHRHDFCCEARRLVVPFQ